MSAHAIRLMLGLAAALPGPGDDPATGPKLSRFEFVETHMGSPFKVVLYSADEATARRASRAAYERIAALDAALSDYNPESELMRLCEKAGALRSASATTSSTSSPAPWPCPRGPGAPST